MFIFSLSLFFFFKILFIYLTETASQREETQAGGVGEEEADSQWRSLMRGSIPERPGSRPEPKADA